MSKKRLLFCGPSFIISISSGVKITTFIFPTISLTFVCLIPFKKNVFLSFKFNSILPSLSSFSYSIFIFEFSSLNFINSLSFFALKDFPITT